MRDLFALHNNIEETFYTDVDPPCLAYSIFCKDDEAAEKVAELIESWMPPDGNWDEKAPSALANGPHSKVVELLVYDIETTNRMLNDLRDQIQAVNPPPPPRSQDWVARVGDQGETSRTTSP